MRVPPERPTNPIGRLIFDRRSERGWTQGQMAHKLNVSEKALSAWENGTRAPSQQHGRALADLVGGDWWDYCNEDMAATEPLRQAVADRLYEHKESVDCGPIEDPVFVHLRTVWDLCVDMIRSGAVLNQRLALQLRLVLTSAGVYRIQAYGCDHHAVTRAATVHAIDALTAAFKAKGGA